MRRALFEPTIEGEARLLILINAFTGRDKSLEGRTKLAKLDFFLRYPAYFTRAMTSRKLSQRAAAEVARTQSEGQNIEGRMIRYRYGPWDPSYYALLGRLVGKGLIESVQERNGVGYRATESGSKVANLLAQTPEWNATAERAQILRRHFDWTGNNLKKFIYENFPEVTQAFLGQAL